MSYLVIKFFIAVIGFLVGVGMIYHSVRSMYLFGYDILIALGFASGFLNLVQSYIIISGLTL